MNEREKEVLERDRSQLIHVLCCAATTAMDEFIIIGALEKGFAETSVTGKSSSDALAAAAYTGRITKVRSMIEEGVDISAKSEYFGRPLEAAASGGHIRIVRLLLKKGFDARTWRGSEIDPSCPFIRLRKFDTALRLASTAGHDDIVRLLLDSKCKSKISQSGYYQAACGAAGMGHAGIVRLLLDRIETVLRPHAEKKIFLTASENGHEVIVQWMLDLGIPANIHENLGSDQPIHGAAARGHDKVVQLLLAGGAKQVRGEYGFPLHYAARGGFLKVAQMLIDHGANIHACAYLGTPIGSALDSGNTHMVRFLIEQGASLDLHMSSELALYYAARDDQETIVRLLVEYGVPVDGIHKEFNPLLTAIIQGHDQVAKVLVELGAKRMDPLETKLVEERAYYLSGDRSPCAKARKSYDELMLNYQRLDKELFPSESASSAIK